MAHGATSERKYSSRRIKIAQDILVSLPLWSYSCSLAGISESQFYQITNHYSVNYENKIYHSKQGKKYI